MQSAMTASLRRAAGSLLVVGLSGKELTGLERAWLKLVRPAGMILFRRNIVDAGQTRALLARLRGCARRMVCGAWMWRAGRWTGCGMRWRRCLQRRRWQGGCENAGKGIRPTHAQKRE